MLSTPIRTIVIGAMKNEIEFAPVESSPRVVVPVHESHSGCVGVMRAAGTYCCDPNALVRNLEVVTSREIQPWEEITFNYNTTEYDIADPFTCRCGSVHCLGEIRGFKRLMPAERESLRFFLAPHLRRILLQYPQFQIGAIPA